MNPKVSGCILLVDDDTDMLAIYSQMLTAAGYEVVCACDADEAYETARGRRPSLILTDLMMDSLDSGFAFAKRVRSDPDLSGVPIVMITSASLRTGFDFSPRSDEDLASMGIDAFLEKPISAGALVETVSRLMSCKN